MPSNDIRKENILSTAGQYFGLSIGLSGNQEETLNKFLDDGNCVTLVISKDGKKLEFSHEVMTGHSCAGCRSVSRTVAHLLAEATIGRPRFGLLQDKSWYGDARELRSDGHGAVIARNPSEIFVSRCSKRLRPSTVKKRWCEQRTGPKDTEFAD